VNQRIQHAILAISVVVLVLTGMPLKFHDTSWAPYLYAMFGGIKAAPIVHKVFGSILVILFIFHVFYLIHIIYRQKILPLKKREGLTVMKVLLVLVRQPLVPNMKDALDIRDLMKYLLYFTNERPKGDKFTWKEKFDYWAPFWGMIIIGFSGLVLWNKEIATTILPGEALNFSLIAHSDEALLAALFLFIWHWYNVHFNIAVFPMGNVFITGYLPEELMVEEHYEYYVQVMTEAGLENEILPPHESHDHKPQQEGEAP
jgi:cytochrome b subunit of formate dehydrogenase